MDKELTFTWTFILKFILGMVLLGIGLFFIHQTPLEDITRACSEIVAVQGGYTEKDIESMKADLQKAGFKLDKLVIQVQAFDVNGENISSMAINITPLNQSPYPSSPRFAPRGSKIVTVVYSTEETALNLTNKSIPGKNASTKHFSRRTVMSERVK